MTNVYFYSVNAAILINILTFYDSTLTDSGENAQNSR